MLLLCFLLEDLAVTSKLKIRARYIERMEINEEKNFLSAEIEWKISTQKKNISGNDNSMAT